MAYVAHKLQTYKIGLLFLFGYEKWIFYYRD